MRFITLLRSFVAASFVLTSIAACAKGDAPSGAGKGPTTATAPISTRVIRAPDVVRRDGNLLAASASEYLREHGHDPVDWRPWNDETIALAAAENKPIFLSIGYSACHFCHVMHDEVFAKDDVARVLNERFISIKVDREERPDLDATYINALLTFSGSAGWPATLFLTSALDPFFGATYVQHDRFLDVAKKAADLYANREGGRFEPLDVRKMEKDRVATSGTPLAEDELRAFASEVTSEMDPVRGGMKGTSKFPMVPRLSFLLHAVRKWDPPELSSLLRVTLDAMAAGALHDPISGGFHRYTTDATWSTPHYEIMLYDDAQLASLYFEAAAAFNEPRFADVARETLDFLASDMRLPNGTFAASFDADTKGEEGAAWRWSEPEITKVLGADGPLIASLLGVAEKKIAPSRRTSIADVATHANVTPKDVDAAWARARPLLRAARANVARRDDKIVAAWNGLTIEAFSRGFVATGEERYRDVAVKAGEALWISHHEKKGSLTRTDGGADAFAADYGDLATGFLALFEATSDPRWLTRADALIREAHVLDAPEGGLYEGRGDLARSVSLEDGAEPSGTGAMLRTRLLRDALGPSDEWHAPVTQALAMHGNGLRARGLGAAAWLDAALTEIGPTYEVVIAGTPKDAHDLIAMYAHVLPSWSVLVRVPAEGADAATLAAMPALAGKTSVSAHARAFVCERTACKAPASDPRALHDELLIGWKK